MLEKLYRFKEQAKQAVCELKRALNGFQPMKFKCLSDIGKAEIFHIYTLSYDPTQDKIEDLADNANECKVDTEYSTVVQIESDNDINIKNELEEVLVSDIKTKDTIDVDAENDNYKLQDIINLGIVKIEDPDNDGIKDNCGNNQVSDNQYGNGNDSAIIKSCSVHVQTDNDINVKNELEEVLVSDIKTEDTIGDAKNGNFQLEEIIDLGIDKIEESDNEDDSTNIKTYSDIDTGHSHENESEQINLPITFDVGGPSSSKVGEREKLENIWTIEKTHGSLYIEITPLQTKKQADLPIQTEPSTNRAGINKERKTKVFYTVKPTCSLKRETIIKCDHCDKMFATKNQKRNHLSSQIKNYTCDQCPLRYKNMADLMKHKLHHLPPKHRPYHCKVCNKGFEKKNLFIVHTSSHTSERPFMCEVCDSTFSSKWSLRMHIISHRSHIGPHIKKPKYRKLKEGKRRTNLSHRKNRRKINNASLKAGIDYKVRTDSEIQCNVCNEKFPTLCAFYKHYMSAQQTIACTECNSSFKNPLTLAEHKKRAHSGTTQYSCNVCGEKYATKYLLKQHTASHSIEKKFKCNECSATFKFQSGLCKHKLIVHKEKKLYQCDICGATFAYRGYLVEHFATHCKDKPFECNICSTKFRYKKNMKKHLKLHS